MHHLTNWAGWKRALGALLLSGLALAGTCAHAAWSPYVTSSRDTGTVDLTGYAQAVNQSGYGSINSAASEVYAQLRQRTGQVLTEQLSAQPGYVRHVYWLSGPLRLTIAPAARDHVVTVGGFKLGFSATYNVSYGPLKYSCTLGLETGPVTLGSGRFDAPNGKFYGLKLVNTGAAKRVDCESNFSWVPVLGWLLDTAGNMAAGGVLDAAWETALNTPLKVFQASSFMTLDQVIRDGALVAGGTDVGAYLRNNLPSLFDNTEASVFIEDPSQVPMPVGVNWDAYFQAVNPPPVQVTSPRFSILFTTPGFSAAFQMSRTYTYGVRWTCPPTQRSCGLPPI